MNPFSIRNYRGAPTFFKNNTPIFPLLFWQTEIEEEDARAFSAAGIELFSFFRSIPHYDHPYWIGENQYDYSRIDTALRHFHQLLPKAYCIPRIYVSAPDWWLQEHPEERCRFFKEAPDSRYEGLLQGTLHESFASERWKKEMGEAFRLLIRHIAEADYASCVIGIHICNGITGEWHCWSPQLRPDTSLAMERYYGHPIPPPEMRDPQYYRIQQNTAVDAIDHFCQIVKQESDFLTVVFYGYMPDMPNSAQWGIEGDHRAVSRLLNLKSVDILSAPHSYERRAVGQDGYFRHYPASVALHNKLFIDEGDDRTWLDGRVNNGVEYVPAKGSPVDCEESLAILRREFGNMLTHNIGMWFMDLNGGNFHDKKLMEEIARLKRWGDYSMRLPRKRIAEVAVIISPESEFNLPPRGCEGNLLSEQLYNMQIGELCRSGVPFDLYLTSDLTSLELKKYKIIVGLDVRFLSSQENAQLTRLLNSNQCTFFYFRPPENPQEAFVSLPPGTELIPTISARELRTRFAEAGAHVYLSCDDVFSVSESAIMIHAVTTGDKCLTLPRKRRLIDLISNEVQIVDRLMFHMQHGETKLFLLENP